MVEGADVPQQPMEQPTIPQREPRWKASIRGIRSLMRVLMMSDHKPSNDPKVAITREPTSRDPKVAIKPGPGLGNPIADPNLNHGR